MKIEQGYDFDDVLLVPNEMSTVLQRDDVDTSVEFGNFKLSVPIIVSPMKGIISSTLIEALSKCGSIGIFHRFEPKEDIIDKIRFAYYKALDFGVSISYDISPTWTEFLEYSPRILCVDVANGYIKTQLKFIETLANYITSNNLRTLLMAGNVTEGVGTKNLINAGANLIRVGIGGGSLCSTRNITGVGCPQLSAIEKSASAVDKDNVYIVSDGGIRNSGDIVKALAFGADCVMIGGMFGRTYESSHNGLIYGMASRKLQEEYFNNVKSVEGIEKQAVKDISAADLLTELSWGIKSACTYLNCRNMKDLGNLYASNFIQAGKGSIKNI